MSLTGDKKRAVRQAHYCRNRDAEIARANAWNKANRDRCNENARRMNAESPERHQEHVKKWRAENPDKVADFKRNATRRMTMSDAFVEDVDRAIVFQRDEGVCGICSQPVLIDDFHIDHIVPLSQGGDHSYNNVQLAHPACNRAKGDRFETQI